MPRSRLDLGDFGERVAAEHLRANGYAVLATKYRCRHGEVDIVARKGATLVFVEVKTRRSRIAGAALETVRPEKLRALVYAAHSYLERHPHDGDLRLDLIALDLREDGVVVSLEHVEGIEVPST